MVNFAFIEMALDREEKPLLRPAIPRDSNRPGHANDLPLDSDAFAPPTVCGTQDDEEDGRPNIPLLSILFSLPCLVLVASLCAIWRPGVLVSLLALAATPVIVFVATLIVAVFVRRRNREND